MFHEELMIVVSNIPGADFATGAASRLLHLGVEAAIIGLCSLGPGWLHKVIYPGASLGPQFFSDGDYRPGFAYRARYEWRRRMASMALWVPCDTQNKGVAHEAAYPCAHHRRQ